MTQILCTCNCSALQRCTALLVCYWFHCICCVGLENVLNVFACVCVCVCLLTARAWIMASPTFKATHNEVPPYLARLLTPYCPSRVLRSSFSCNLFALTLLSVLAASVQLHQWFGIPFLTLSIHPIHLTLSGTT